MLSNRDTALWATGLVASGFLGGLLGVAAYEAGIFAGSATVVLVDCIFMPSPPPNPNP